MFLSGYTKKAYKVNTNKNYNQTGKWMKVVVVKLLTMLAWISI